MRTLTLLSAVALACGVQAQQLQNPNFEQWSVSGTNWNNDPIYTANSWNGGEQTTDSYTGTYAAKLPPIVSCGLMTSWMVYGTLDVTQFDGWSPVPVFTGSGAPINYKPTNVSGYFKFLSPDTLDEARGIVILKRFNAVTQQSEEVGHGELVFSPSTVYTAFNIAVTDLQPGVEPDSIVLAFSSGSGYSWDFETDSVHTGTLYIDQLRVQGAPATAGIDEQAAAQFSIFPNPAADMLNFTFATAENDAFALVMFDSAGKRVFETSAQKDIRQSVDLTQFSAGTYRVVLAGKHRTYAQKMIVVAHP